MNGDISAILAARSVFLSQFSNKWTSHSRIHFKFYYIVVQTLFSIYLEHRRIHNEFQYGKNHSNGSIPLTAQFGVDFSKLRTQTYDPTCVPTSEKLGLSEQRDSPLRQTIEKWRKSTTPNPSRTLSSGTRVQNTLLRNEIGILIILTQNSLTNADHAGLWRVWLAASCILRNFYPLTIGMFCEWKNSKCATLSFHALTLYAVAVGLPSRIGTPQDEFKWIWKMTLAPHSSLLLYYVPSSTVCPFFAALCVTFFKFRFHFYYFLRIAPFYFLLIYIDKNNTHLMDDDFCFSLYTTQLMFVALFTSSSSSNQYALIRCFCFFWCSSSKYLCLCVFV